MADAVQLPSDSSSDNASPLLPLSAALAACGIARWTLDRAGTLEFDPAAAVLLEQDPERLRDAGSWLEHVDADDRAYAESALRDAAAGPERAFRVVRPDGGLRWLLARRHSGEAGELIATGVLIDVSAISAAAEAQQIERTRERVSMMAAGLAHDFNNLLFAILGNASLALGTCDLPLEHPLRDSLSEIERATVRATDIVQRMSLFSRPLQIKRRPTQLSAAVEAALESLRPTLPDRVMVRVRAASGLPPIAADAKLVEQVVINGVSNALHALEAGEPLLELTMSERWLGDEPWFPALQLPPGRYLELAIRDHGVGMDAGIQRRIFEPFFSTRPKGKGLGIGLPIVQRIMDAHGGGLRIESAPGRGTTLYTYFPL